MKRWETSNSWGRDGLLPTLKVESVIKACLAGSMKYLTGRTFVFVYNSSSDLVSLFLLNCTTPLWAGEYSHHTPWESRRSESPACLWDQLRMNVRRWLRPPPGGQTPQAQCGQALSWEESPQSSRLLCETKGWMCSLQGADQTDHFVIWSFSILANRINLQKREDFKNGIFCIL